MMADVTVSYKNNVLTEINSTETKTLKTAGTYLEDDITIAYEKPQGGSSVAEDFLDQMDQDFQQYTGSVAGILKALRYPPYINAPLATTIGTVFQYNNNVVKIKMNISSIRDADAAFAFSPNLTEVEFVGEGKITNFRAAFANASKLTSISGTPLNLSLATNIDSMFLGCKALINVRFKENSINKTLDFSSCTKLSTESILSILNGCNNLSDSVGSQIISFDTSVVYKIPEIMSAIKSATLKRWTVKFGNTVVTGDEPT